MKLEALRYLTLSRCSNSVGQARAGGGGSVWRACGTCRLHVVPQMLQYQRRGGRGTHVVSCMAAVV